MYWLKAIFTPACWIQNECYSAAWDAELNRLLESEKFRDVGRHTAKIGGLEIWIANHPYASFTPVDGPKVRPKRGTILRAFSRLGNDYFTSMHNVGAKLETTAPVQN